MLRSLCPQIEAIEIEERVAGRKFTIEELQKKSEYCYEGRYETLPFTLWRSDEPIFLWFGSIVHSTSAILFCCFIGFVFINIFKDK
jgi:hypothetical protein